MSSENKTGSKKLVGRLVLAAIVAAFAVAAAQSRAHTSTPSQATASSESESQLFEGTQQP